MTEPAYVSRVRITRQGGPQRLAYLPAGEQPVAFGVHDEVAEHYGVAPGAVPPRPTTLDYVVAAAGGWLAGTYAGALEARRVEVDPERYEAEAVGDVENVDGVLVIRRITVTYRIRLPEEHHDTARRVLEIHARACPVARSLEGAIVIETKLELDPWVHAAASGAARRGGEPKMTRLIARVPTWGWTALAVFVALNVLFWSWD